MLPFRRKCSSFVMTLLILVILSAFVSPSFQQQPVVNPCRLAKVRHHPKFTPFIRIIDELTGEGPDVLLGTSGSQSLPFYTLLPKTPIPIVIECSSSLGPVEWSYRGRGATSGVKVVPSVWTRPVSPDSEAILRPNCHSAALIISNVTDQLTGEYSCKVVDGHRDKKQVENSFVIFAPQSAPFYYPEGDVVKLTLASLQEPVLTLPCISKRRSGAGIGLFREILEVGTNETKLDRMELGSGIQYNPFIGFQLKPTKQLFNSDGAVNFTCKFEKNLKGFTDLQNRTLLRVLVHLRQEEKIAPETSPVTAFSPYFSWTSLAQPVIELEQRSGFVTPSEWQQIYTKNDFEEGNSSAAIFHLGSLHLLNGGQGSEGTVSLRQKANGQLIHSWDYKVLDKEKEPFVGLSYSHDPHEGQHHVFTCVSATKSNPNLTFKNLMSDEMVINTGNETLQDYTVIGCPDHPDPSLGCLILTTIIPVGEVVCKGDGVHSTVRYPLGFVEPSRPFFVDRGQRLQLTVGEENVVVTLPCLTNAPEAQPFVHLFWKRNNDTDDDKGESENWEKVWPPASDVEQTEIGIEFYPDWGFHLDTSNPKWANPAGEFLCSSSGDLEDRSDAVRIIVTKQGWSVSPKTESISAELPYSLRWAWSGSEEVVVEEIGLRDHVKMQSSSPGERWTKAELLITPELFARVAKDAVTMNVTLMQKQGQIHKWTLTRLPFSQNLGLTMTTSWDQVGRSETNSSIEIICRGSLTMVERDRPRLSYYVCQNTATCQLIKKCQDKNCNHEQHQQTEEETEDCGKEQSCLRQVLRSLPLNGYLTAVCKYNGLTETGTVFDFFFREDVNWEFDSAKELVFLSANAPTTEQNPAREVVDMGSNLIWELGESVTFSCGASPTSFSQGIRWALQDSEGVFHFQPQELYDPQWKYSAPTQLLSTFTFHVTSIEVKKVWCFVPTQPDENGQIGWKNMSHVFIREEIEENCHDVEPSIRLISVYPPPSVLYNDSVYLTELVGLGSFVVPKGLLQFVVVVTAPEPVEWSFLQGNGNRVAGPSSTPQVQSDRTMTNFYDPSTYCYSSKLLVNLRTRDSEMDTGTYVAKFGDKTLSLHVFVPNDKHPYLINSGNEINVTLESISEGNAWHLPCLLNNPDVEVRLFKQKSDGFVEVTQPTHYYGPTKGFTFTRSNTSEQELLGTWKCIAGENAEDFVVIHALPKQQKKSGLKYELVGDIHVFTCNSENETNPTLTLTSMSNKKDSVSINEHTFERKDCFGGCSIITTTESKGLVICLGEGVNATYALGQDYDDKTATDARIGIWFDAKEDAFKCQLSNYETNSSVIYHPNLVGITCRRPGECGLMQQHLRGDGDHSQAIAKQCGPGCSQLKIRKRVKPSWSPNWFSVILRCNDTFAQFFQDRGVIVSATKESVASLKTVRLDVVSFRKEGSGLLQAKLRCFANRYFYSRGISWGIEKADGSLQFQDHSTVSEVEIQSFNAVMSEIRLDWDESQPLKRVWCFVPILKSAKWANASIPLPINDLTFNLL